MLPATLQSELENKCIFITGGTGTFGKWLIHELKNITCQLVILTRDTKRSMQEFPEHALGNIRFAEGDVRDFQYPLGHFDYVIHAATPVVSDKLSDTELTDIIVTGTKRVLDFSTQSGCPRLLYISSGAVYGTTPPELDHIPESFPCNPITTYGKAKRIAENLCIHSGVNSVVARCFAFVGPGLPLDAHFAIGNFIRNCMRNEPIMIRGDGTPLRSYMYSSDLVEWLLRIMVNSKPDEIYNVGSEVPISMVDLAHRVRDCSGVDVEITVCQSPDGSQMPESYIPCTRKAMNKLSLKLKFDLENSIQNTLHALGHEPSV